HNRQVGKMFVRTALLYIFSLMLLSVESGKNTDSKINCYDVNGYNRDNQNIRGLRDERFK
ncbi:hypothetical protein PJO51_28875, partial [Mycobacterium kansasii]